MGDIQNMLLTTDMNFQQLADRFAFPEQSAFGQYFAHQVRGAHHKRHTRQFLTEFHKRR